MNTHIITFQSDGTAQCLWTEAVPLQALGRLHVSRASTIEFNEPTQQWQVKDMQGRLRFFARSRAACLDWEHENLEPSI